MAGRGRPAHQPTDKDRAIVWEMSAFGIPQDRISRSMGISEDTLQKYYRQELDVATDDAVTTVGRNLYRMANGDGKEALSACIFFLKTRGGWQEKPEKGELGGNAGTLTIRWEDERDSLAISATGGPVGVASKP
tara:strand:- start:134 stop:535 length:402 start_codon:yes stop_codon:yes gene_type:complete